MKWAAILLLLFSSCSAWEASKDPATVTLVAGTAGWALGPIGAGAAAGATSLLLDLAESENDTVEAEKETDDLRAEWMAWTRGVVAEASQETQDEIAAEAAQRIADQEEAAIESAAARLDDRNWAQNLVQGAMKFMAWVLGITVVVLVAIYIRKQFWSKGRDLKREAERFGDFWERVGDKIQTAVEDAKK